MFGNTFVVYFVGKNKMIKVELNKYSLFKKILGERTNSGRIGQELTYNHKMYTYIQPVIQ